MKKTDIKLEKNKESNIEIKLSKEEKKRKNKELQRTKKWRKKRLGRWTSSQLKQLMSSAQGKGRLEWDNIDKLFSFGSTALKYIYENAMERKTGRYIDDGEGTYQMRYGTRVEPLIEAIVTEKLKDIGEFKKVGFKKFSKIPNAGVSSDGVIIDSKTKKVIGTVEMKACTTWQTHYERTFEATNEKSKDFWQIVGHCEAYDVKICYYAVAQPPEDIKKYLFYSGNIIDMLDEFKKECKVSIETVLVNKNYKIALLKRIIIAEDTLNDWLATECTERLDSLLDANIKLYQEDQNLFDKYIPPINFQKKSFFDKQNQKLKKKKKQKKSK